MNKASLEPETAPAQNPVVVPRQEHTISRRDICPYALKVLYRLIRNGHTAYLVGGGVRDLLLGNHPKDFDISTDASPGKLKKLFRNCWLIGRRFRLAHIKFGDTIIETSTFRANPVDQNCANGNGEEPDDLYVRDDNIFGTPEEDAFRRDFTINGLFYDVESFSVIDFVGGLNDIDNRLLRTIGEPHIRFREDPVRMIRAIRFASRLGFTIEENTLSAIQDYAAEIEKASRARLMDDIQKLFGFGAGSDAFRLLEQTGILPYIFPALQEFLDNSPESEKAKFWKIMQLNDRHTKLKGEANPALAFASVLSGIWCSSPERKENKAGHVSSFVRKISRSLNDRLNFPRRIREQIDHILISQFRFEGHISKRFRKNRFAVRPFFADSLRLFAFVSEAEGLEQDTVIEWLKVYQSVTGDLSLAEELLGENCKEIFSENNREHNLNDNSNSNRQSKRSRSRRKRKKKTAAGNDAENNVSKPASACDVTENTDTPPSAVKEPEEKITPAPAATQAAPADTKKTTSRRKKKPAEKEKPDQSTPVPPAPAPEIPAPQDYNGNTPDWMDEI